MLAGVVDVETASEDRDRSARPLQRGLVRGGVHAPGEAGGDRHAGGRELPRQPPGHVAAVARSVAGAHHGHDRKLESLEPAQREEEKRRVGDLPESLGVLGIEGRQDAHPGLLDTPGPSFGFDVVARPQNGAGALRGAQKSGQFHFFGGQNPFDPAARSKDRPELLRSDAPSRPGQRRAATEGICAHRFK
jgi:hypothetical protein